MHAELLRVYMTTQTQGLCVCVCVYIYKNITFKNSEDTFGRWGNTAALEDSWRTAADLSSLCIGKNYCKEWTTRQTYLSNFYVEILGPIS